MGIGGFGEVRKWMINNIKKLELNIIFFKVNKFSNNVGENKAILHPFCFILTYIFSPTLFANYNKDINKVKTVFLIKLLFKSELAN